MTSNDNADRGGDRRDGDAIPVGCPDCIDIAFADGSILVLRRKPRPLARRLRNLAEICRRLRSGGDA